MVGSTWTNRRWHSSDDVARPQTPAVVDFCIWIDFALRVLSRIRRARFRRSFTASCRQPLAFTVSRTYGERSILDGNIPPLEAHSERRILALIDSYDDERARIDWPEEGSPTVPEHLRMASSTGRKGRLLTALIHEFQPRHILEVGTAYGVSAAFMLEANAETHVVTVETFSPMKELSARRLQSRYPGRVTIVHQPIDEWLQGRDPVFDAVFHDGHHDGPGYVRDFQAIVPRLTSGAVFVFDDIRYGDPAVYRGWQQVVRDERVEAAYEVDNDLGVLILH